MGNCCNSRESVDPSSTPKHQSDKKIVFTIDDETVSSIRKSISSKNNNETKGKGKELTPPPSRRPEKHIDLSIENKNATDKQQNDENINISNSNGSIAKSKAVNILPIVIKKLEEIKFSEEDKGELLIPSNEAQEKQNVEKSTDISIDITNDRSQPVTEKDKSTIPLIASKTMNEDYLKELEKKKERIYNRFKQQEEEEKNKATADNTEVVDDIHDQIDNYRLKHRLTAAKKRAEELHHKKSIRILNLAKQLEEHLHKEGSDIKQELKEIDDYTKMLMDKPFHSKKSRKFTRFNFVLEDDK